MAVLAECVGDEAQLVYDRSPLLQYVNSETKSASRGSKARSSFANLYALYVLVEDYLAKGYHESGAYHSYEGAVFSRLFERQRELPFGSKLQNHALNHRLNEKFAGQFPTCDPKPIIRDTETDRYWINESLLLVPGRDDTARNIAPAVIGIVEAYISAKRTAFTTFVEDCQRLQGVGTLPVQDARAFVRDLLRPEVDARIFEIVSFAILKAHYAGQTIFWGWQPDDLLEDRLSLYKTGRTNANDGGIDFVMRPLGRFFQVTEAVSARKYFLDIDKIERYPLTFVIKSEHPPRQDRRPHRE